MRKRWYRRFLIIAVLSGSILGTGFCIEELQKENERQQVSTGDVASQMVIPGGMPIGIYMKTDGILILGTGSVEADNGQSYSPSERLVKSGDYIVGINGDEVFTKKELISKIEDLETDSVVLKLRREDEIIAVKLKPILTEDKTYKLGIWVRDSVQGLGTVTYITADNEFGALGHGIHDTDTDELLEIAEGRVYDTKILRIEKGQKGSPGGMEGMIVYNRYNILGSIEKNTDIGVFGTVKKTAALTADTTAIPVCSKNNVKTGAACIRCCVDGEVKEYEIEIQKVNHFSLEVNKSMVIKVVDKELLKITGGIVQGMSGSPILQDEKIVGAVTHVLVNDPTRGYGIFIEDMIKQ